MERKRGKTAPWFLAAALAISVLSAAIVGGWHWLFYRSFCVYEDCRGQGIDVETMKQWEERAEALGIVRMAGWRRTRGRKRQLPPSAPEDGDGRR